MHLYLIKLHPHPARLVRATADLDGKAPKGAVKWCRPYTHANAAGWLLYPPVTMRATYHGDSKWDVTIDTDFEGDESSVLRTAHGKWGGPFTRFGRKHFTAGYVEPDVLSIWTGLIFRTPPGWCTLVTSPVNRVFEYRTQVGIVETDWMPYDIWINLKVPPNTTARIDPVRPIAQLIPVPRQTTKKWSISDAWIYDDEREYERWQKYNYDKWLAKPEKDPGLHNREATQHHHILAPIETPASGGASGEEVQETQAPGEIPGSC